MTNKRVKEIFYLFNETGPSSPHSIRLQYRYKGKKKPFADVELHEQSNEVSKKAAELFLLMMREMNK